MSGSQSTKSELDKLKKEQVKIFDSLEKVWGEIRKLKESPEGKLEKMKEDLKKAGWKDEDINDLQKRGGVTIYKRGVGV